MAKKRILSGIRISGNIHLGVYIGSIQQWLERQADKNNENWYFLADLHGITTPYDPKRLKELTYEAIMLYMACGLDPEKSTIFVQSHIPAHAELAWLLNCNTPMSWMNQMIQYKEKSSKIGDESVSVGLFDYPVLMAADILLYDTDLVPVGEDQSQHVEIAREIARRFNRINGQVFTEPDILLQKEAARILALDNPEEKMSKSAASKYNYINLLDKPDEVAAKIAKAVTDAGSEIKFDQNRKAINNLLIIYQQLTGENSEAIEQKFAGKGYAQFKKELTKVINEFLMPIRERYDKFNNNRDYFDEILAHGTARAKLVADKTLARAKKKVGLIEPLNPAKMEKKPVISFDDWLKNEILIGEISAVDDIEGADKLIKLKIDFGKKGETVIAAGIKEYYKKEDLIGKKVPVLWNLEPKEIKGIKSQGMMLAVDNQGKAVLLNPEKEVDLGSMVM